MADPPIIINTETDMFNFFTVLMQDGWEGTFAIGKGTGAERAFLCDAHRAGEVVRIQLGGIIVSGVTPVPAVLVPMNDRTKYLQYTTPEFTQLQAALGGG